MASAGNADKAITELNGTQLCGRTLNVNEARRRLKHTGVGAAKAVNAAEAGDVGNHETAISGEHQSSSPKGG
jgi:RNA recognition motif-containing protein